MAHAEFCLSVVRDELVVLLPSASVAQFMEAVGATGESGEIADAILPALFTAHDQIRWKVAEWISHAIPLDSQPTIDQGFREFILKLSSLCASETGLVYNGRNDDTGMKFLWDLHLAYFLAHPTDPTSVRSWSSTCKFIDISILKVHDGSTSNFLLKSLTEMLRANPSQYFLPKLSVQSRLRLFESMMEALLALGDNLDQPPAQKWCHNEALMSFVDILAPWVPCIRALSFNHSVVMSSIMKHAGLCIRSLFFNAVLILAPHSLPCAGPAFTKGRALSSFLKTMFRIDVILLHVWDQKDDPQSASKTSDLSSNLISRHRVTDLLNAARTCLQRLSVSVRVRLDAPASATFVIHFS
jgi:hypothetical protein